MKRQTTILGAMLMTAFEAGSRIAEHKGTRHKGRSSVRGPVLESAPYDGGHAYQFVLLFEWAVVGAGRANHVVEAPTWARRQQMAAQ
jgi:hypothetical protein